MKHYYSGPSLSRNVMSILGKLMMTINLTFWPEVNICAYIYFSVCQPFINLSTYFSLKKKNPKTRHQTKMACFVEHNPDLITEIEERHT